MRPYTLRYLLLVAATTCGAGMARAQESTADLEGLLQEPVVSTPSRSAQMSVTAPATTTVISADELRRYGLRSLDEVIDFASLGMTTSSTLRYSEIGARGVLLTVDYGNHVLLLVDGHPLNEPWNGTAYFDRGAGIPFELIDHVEVSLGPGSVMYGSQAMLGVINIVTKRAKDYAGWRVIAEAETSLPSTTASVVDRPATSASDLGAGYRLGGGGGHVFHLFGTPAELTVQAEYYSMDGPTLWYAPQNYGDDAITAQPKDFGPNTSPGVWGGRVDDDFYTRVPTAYARLSLGDVQALVRLGAFIRGTPQIDSTQGGSADFDLRSNREVDHFGNAELSYANAVSAASTMKLRAYSDVNKYHWYSTTSAAEDCLPGQVFGCKRHLRGTGRLFGAEVQFTNDWFSDSVFTTFVGLDASARNASSEYELVDRSSGVSSLVPGGRYERTDALIAPYAEQTYAPARWLDLRLGLRGDFDTRFGRRASPRAAAAARLWPGNVIKLIYAEAFRAPSAYELLYSDPTADIPARELAPETTRSVETSFEQRFGTHRLLFGIFRSSWNHMVQYTAASDEEIDAAIERGELNADVEEAGRYRNAGRIDNYGYNFSYESVTLQGRLHGAVNVTSAYTRIHSADSASALPPTVGPQLFGNARISYTFDGNLPTLGLAASAMQRRPADRAFDGGFSEPPYAPAHIQLKATISGVASAIPGLSYRAGLTYTPTRQGPYVVGPNAYATDETSRAELNPIVQLNAFAGIEYQF